MTFLCPFCNEESYDNLISLSTHYRKKHKKPSKDLYIALYTKNIEPTCKCGCGEKTKFLGIEAGFRDYKRGHSSRVNNNYQTNKSKTNSIASRRKLIANGIYKPFRSSETGNVWNAGLTKQTDCRVAKMAAAINQPEEIKIRSERMRKNRMTGVIKTLKGKDHSQWKGGISDLGGVCHSNPKYYKDWKYPKLLASGFKCTKCGKQGNGGGILQVHHDKERFSEVVNSHAEKFNWYQELQDAGYDLTNDNIILLKTKISEAVMDYHIKNDVSGIVLCKFCHKKEHKSYNFT